MTNPRLIGIPVVIAVSNPPRDGGHGCGSPPPASDDFEAVVSLAS
ncbi:MAG: hypothetical protein RLZ86_1513 [Actinomycetota bacterium]|jgi:hypothetical protein